LTSLLSTWRSNLSQFLVRQTHYYSPMGYYYLAIALPAALAVALSARRLAAIRVELAALVLAFAYMLVYLNFIDWMPGMRYYAPLVGLLLVPFSLLDVELRGRPSLEQPWREHVSFGLLGLVLGLASLSVVAIMQIEGQQLHKGTQESLVPLGRWLRETMPADSILAMSDVGATPFYSRLTTVDINPSSLTDRHIAENGWSSEYFFQVSPDVVALTAFSQTVPDFYSEHEALYAMPEYQSNYTRIGVVRNDWFQDRSYWVFLKRGAELTPEQLASFPLGLRKPR
jgi:hypothetical protein